MTISNNVEAYLLDAAVLFRLLYEPGQIRREVYTVLQSPKSNLLVSHLTLWETFSKVFRGANSLDRAALELELDKVRRLGTGFVSLTQEDVMKAVALPDIHRDPFDRMLIAQAQRLGATIISSDRKLPLYDVAVMPL